MARPGYQREATASSADEQDDQATREHEHEDDENETEAEGTSKVHLTDDDYRIIVTWLEDDANFALCYGSGKKPKVGGPPKLTKIQAFQRMADYLFENSMTPNLPHLKGSIMKQRWQTHMNKFKKTLNMKHTETGLGITMSQMKRGMTIAEKLEQKCACYARMVILFGEKPNVRASSTVEIGVPTGCRSTIPPRQREPVVADSGSPEEGDGPAENIDAVDQRCSGNSDSDGVVENNCSDLGEVDSSSREGCQSALERTRELLRRSAAIDVDNSDEARGETHVGDDCLNEDRDEDDEREDGVEAELPREDRAGVASGLRPYYDQAVADLASSYTTLIQDATVTGTSTSQYQQSTSTANRNKTGKTKNKQKRKSTDSSSSNITSGSSNRGQARETAQQSRLSISDNFSRAMLARQKNDKRKLDQIDAEAAERKLARVEEHFFRKKQLELQEKDMEEARKQEAARREHEKELHRMKILAVVIKEGKTPQEAQAYFSLLSDMNGAAV